MTSSQLQQMLRQRNLVLDGAIGTELQQAGLPQGVCPEHWCLQHREVLAGLHRGYANAGADVVYSATFGANRLKLAEFGLDQETGAINRALVELCRGAVPEGVLIAGSVGPTGHLLEPFGETPFEDAVAAFRQQIEALAAAGVDLLAIETMADIQEARAALLAAREVGDLAVMVTLTFGDDGRTLSGTTPEAAVVTLQSLGATVVGCNCSSGPSEMQGILTRMRQFARVPLLAKPNAGLPRLHAGQTVFDMKPAVFARDTAALLDSGASLVGGCCGTTVAHIAALREACAARPPSQFGKPVPAAVSGSRVLVQLEPNRPLVIIGERINPTGKAELKAELRQHCYTMVRQLALQQSGAGASILDVNVGTSGIDEAAVLRQAVRQLSGLIDQPLCLDSADPAAVEAALRLYPGRALLNSISAEPHKRDALLPLVARYGAMFVFLPISETGVPETAGQRLQVLESFMLDAAAYGCTAADLLVDGLVLSVSANDQAARETLATVAGATERGFRTVLGLSNVSFGLPRRSQLNSVFLAMAAANGLTAAIANPCVAAIMELKHAADLLRGVDPHAKAYLGAAAATQPDQAAAPPATAPAGAEQQLYEAVLTGDTDQIAKRIEGVLQLPELTAKTILSTILIPAITEAGERFDQRVFYLPQLMSSARAMQLAFDYLQPHLASLPEGMAAPVKIVLATVKGDVHDIGKNIVALMLRNYGFEVIDLGKDVSTERIVEAVRASGAPLLGLSALMTTTMTEMAAVVRACRAAGLANLQFMVGGAVVDASFAESIGAHYAADSVAAVRLAKTLTNS